MYTSVDCNNLEYIDFDRWSFFRLITSKTKITKTDADNETLLKLSKSVFWR